MEEVIQHKKRDIVEILLVEDNDDDAKLAFRAFRKHNIDSKVHHLRDGQEALEFLESTTCKIKLILLDVKLPRLNGLQFLQVIKNDPKTNMIPVVVLTSSKEENDIVQSYRFGVNSYISKPIEFKEFETTIDLINTYWMKLNNFPA